MRYMNCAAGELKRGINCMIIVFKQLAVAARASIDVPEYRNKYTLMLEPVRDKTTNLSIVEYSTVHVRYGIIIRVQVPYSPEIKSS